MSVYKEMRDYVRRIKSESVQIYSDAADFGVPIYSNEDSIIKETKEMIKMYDMERTEDNYETGTTILLKFDGGFPAVIEAGFEWATIDYVTCKNTKVGGKKIKGYLSLVDFGTTPKAKKEVEEYHRQLDY
jgi:hypothetical protein